VTAAAAAVVVTAVVAAAVVVAVVVVVAAVAAAVVDVPAFCLPGLSGVWLATKTGFPPAGFDWLWEP